MRKLNLACGFNKKEGFINIDIDHSVKPDVIRDIERGLPFDDDSVDEIYAHHILEHINPQNFIFVLSEIYRVCKKGAIIEIEVPLGITDDPTHKTFFTPTSFDHWLPPREKKTGWTQEYYGKNIKFEEVDRIVFPTPQMVIRILLRVVK